MGYITEDSGLRCGKKWRWQAEASFGSRWLWYHPILWCIHKYILDFATAF
jgi:hypothetical protein